MSVLWILILCPLLRLVVLFPESCKAGLFLQNLKKLVSEVSGVSSNTRLVCVCRDRSWKCTSVCTSSDVF